MDKDANIENYTNKNYREGEFSDRYKKKKYFRHRFFKKYTKKSDNIKPYSENAKDNSNIVRRDQLVSVVIPLYNEEESLFELSLKLKSVLDSLQCNYEVLFVDDGSTDRSFERIVEINKRMKGFRCIKLRKNSGKSAALSAGFKMAKGDFVITMDADLQDDPEEIPELLKVLKSGYDLVSGWKKIRYDPFIKKHTSKLFNYVTSKFSGIRLHDFNCGLKAYKKDVIKNVKIYGELHRFIPALAHLSGFKVTEKIVKHHPRKFGVTKFGANRFFNGFFDLLTVVFTTKYIKRPMHVFGFFGIISFFAGFIITLYLTYLKFFTGASISNRPLFLIGILFIILGFQSFSLGLIAEMITKESSTNEESIIETIL